MPHGARASVQPVLRVTCCDRGIDNVRGIAFEPRVYPSGPDASSQGQAAL